VAITANRSDFLEISSHHYYSLAIVADEGGMERLSLIPYGFGPQGFAMGLRTGAPGVFQVEWSEDLLHWTPFQTVTNATEAEEWIVDPEALQAPRRFYRAVLQR